MSDHNKPHQPNPDERYDENGKPKQPTKPEPQENPNLPRPDQR